MKTSREDTAKKLADHKRVHRHCAVSASQAAQQLNTHVPYLLDPTLAIVHRVDDNYKDEWVAHLHAWMDKQPPNWEGDIVSTLTIHVMVLTHHCCAGRLSAKTSR